jgi:hypothetical protein
MYENKKKTQRELLAQQVGLTSNLIGLANVGCV